MLKAPPHYNEVSGAAIKPKTAVQMPETSLPEDKTRILPTICARRVLRLEDIMSYNVVAAGIIDGRRINLKRGTLGLVRPTNGEIIQDEPEGMVLSISEEKPSLAATVAP